ncbi:hypothetical protein K8S19_10870 [bacterium]|nr:hypothetical protein [bacterium]
MLYLVIGVLFISSLTGCNLFTTMHNDGKESNASVLVADGHAAMSKGDYVKAAEYFRLACEHDSVSSEARVGYAEAYMKAQGFSLGEFVNVLMSALESDSGDSIELLVPSHWGVTTMAEVEVMLRTLIAVLDPVALGQTSGPYVSTDATINLTLGIFYILKITAKIEVISTDFAITSLNKTTDSVLLAGLFSPALLAQLPEDFYWLLDSANNQPSLGFITDMQIDIDSAMARLQTAAEHSGSGTQELITDVMTMFEDWQTLAYQ